MKQLSDLQIAILRVLWKQGEAPILLVHQELGRERRLATTTVATILSRMEKAGLVTHRTDGRQYMYRALVTDEVLRSSMIDRLVRQLFQGSTSALVNHLLSDSDISPEDLAHVKALIAEREAKESQSHAK